MKTFIFKRVTCQTLIIVFTVMFFSCNDDEEQDAAYKDGIYITNEGSYGSSNASLSFYSYNDDSVYNYVFEETNGRSLGDVAQSVSTDDNYVYIVVNNSNKIEVADLSTLEEKGVISDVSSPRYMLINNSKGYLSCWGDNTVKVINTEDLSVSNSISVGAGPEKMLITGNSLYVANTGGYSIDSVITVIDLDSEAVTDSIIVKYVPQDMVIDDDGMIWVLTYGKVVYESVSPYGIIEETASKLYKINSSTNAIELEYSLFDSQHPCGLEIDEDGYLYLGGGYSFEGIYKVDISGSEPSLTKIIDDWAYGLNYDNESDVLFVTISTDFTVSGYLKRYSTDGSLLGTYTCGIGPNGTTYN